MVLRSQKYNITHKGKRILQVGEFKTIKSICQRNNYVLGNPYYVWHDFCSIYTIFSMSVSVKMGYKVRPKVRWNYSFSTGMSTALMDILVEKE